MPHVLIKVLLELPGCRAKLFDRRTAMPVEPARLRAKAMRISPFRHYFTIAMWSCLRKREPEWCWIATNVMYDANVRTKWWHSYKHRHQRDAEWRPGSGAWGVGRGAGCGLSQKQGSHATPATAYTLAQDQTSSANTPSTTYPPIAACL